jgi:hypothetical protein
MRWRGSVATGVVVFGLASGVAPAGAKGPQPSSVRAPAEATGREVITIRARIKGLVPAPDGTSNIAEPLLLRRVTRQRPLMWIGQEVAPVNLVHVSDDQYSARLTVPSTPGRYLFHTERFRLWELNQASGAERARASWLIVRAAIPSPLPRNS